MCMFRKMGTYLDGKVVAITGGGRGIGRGIAHHLGKHGASIVVKDLAELLGKDAR